MRTGIINFLLIIILLISACEHKNQIEIILNNKDLHYAPIFNLPKDSSDYEIINSVYPRYKNKSDWDNSINYINFKIINKTKNKMFLINPKFITDEISDLDSTITKSNIYFEIMNGKNEKLPFIGFNATAILPFDIQAASNQLKKDSIARDISVYKNYEDEKRFKNYVILEPSQNTNLTTKLSLPIPINYENVAEVGFGLPMYQNEVYKCRLHYILNKIDIEKNIPRTILDSLRGENVTIKDIHFSSEVIYVFPSNENQM